MKRSTFVKLISAVAGSALLGSTVQAQSPSDKPITLVVAFAAGTPADIFARTIADDLQVSLKRTVIVDNRPGANQVIAAAQVARSPADGQTLLLMAEPAVIPPSILKSQPFSSMADFEAVAHLLSLPVVLMTAPNMPVSNLRELIALLKANPGKYSFATTGVGSPTHLFMEQIHKEAGIKAVHVPYKSYPSSMTDTMSDVIHYSFAPISAMEFVKQGRLKAIALSSLARDPDFPTLPTFDESGMKGFEASLNYYILAPKGTPSKIVGQLNTTINAAVASPTFAAKVKPIGGVVIATPKTPVQARALLAREEQRWTDLVKTQNIDLSN
jgi:tripartite-type tricarboxylate transporter receptor subunit TctC